MMQGMQERRVPIHTLGELRRALDVRLLSNTFLHNP